MDNIPIQITNFFMAMQAGPSGEEILQNLFWDDATYREPFSGQTEPHKGAQAIINAFRNSRTSGFEDAVVTLNFVELDGAIITVGWTCFADAIPGGKGSGTNIFEMRDGKIASLTTTLDMGEAK